MNKYYNPLEKQTDTQVRHAQVIYLAKVLNKPADAIAHITGYCHGTVKAYIRKFEHLLDWAKKIFTKVKEEVVNIKNEVSYGLLELQERITWEVEPPTKPCAYLIEYFNKKGEFVWLKVGMTKRPLRVRVSEHLNDRGYKKAGCYRAVVKNYFECECGDDASTMENALRKYYRSQNNSADYLPLDRFTCQRYNETVMHDEKINLMYKLLTE